MEPTQRTKIVPFVVVNVIDQVFKELKIVACDFLPLQKHLLFGLKVLKGKQRDLLARRHL
jgi:hypothetical protein